MTAESTREMAALLERCAARVDPSQLTFIVNDRRALFYEQQLREPRPMLERLALQFEYSLELLKSGRNAEALQALAVAEAAAQAGSPETWESNSAIFAVVRALAHLRTGEEENCISLHNRDSCLLPIRGQGVHQRREGATRAVETLTGLLERAPDNLVARWLLNIAHMTLGRYPDGVPRRYLIPPGVFAAEYPLPPFTNLAAETGVDLLGRAGGAILDDFDNDGRLDLMVSGLGFTDQLRVWRNGGGGTFEERTEAAGLRGEVGGLNLIQADYDNDGFVDVVVLRGGWMGSQGRFPLSLLRNRGDGTFADVTRAAGLLRFAPTQTAAFFDYDRDGWLDLFVGNESQPDDPYPCHLFRSNRDGTFTDVALPAGVALLAFVKAAVAGDYDNDGWPDLYVSVADGDNVLFHNEGGPSAAGGRRFTNVARAAGVLAPHFSFGTFFFDYDNDGWLDLFVAGYGKFAGGFGMAQTVAADYLGLPTDGERGRLYHNRRDGSFEDVTRAAGLYKVVPAMGLNFGDLDNDGFLDVYLGTGNPDLATLVPNRMFRNDGGRAFQDVTTAGNFGHLQKGHGVAFGDVDNDGDQDVFEQMGGAYLADTAHSALYANPGNRNGWLGLELEGVRSNRKAIGARLEVAVEANGRRRVFHRLVGSGSSFGGSALRQQIGLGDAAGPVTVRVVWPATGQAQTFGGLRSGRWYAIREGSASAAPLDRPGFALAGAAPPGGPATGE